ncbi:extracellular solute-binding protein [Luteococcus peritonei]|uniref:Extracellular solute-binding protein n=1 Tax=Luteococcus peritonei TaxID=88874 RepID=A0ABW4RVA1_9ACTN
MNARRTTTLLAALTVAASFTACSSNEATPASEGGSSSTAAAGGEGTLVVYTNSNAEGRAEWLTEEAKKQGLTIQVVGQGGGDTTNKLLAEKNNPVADVVFGLNNVFYEQLEAADILEDYTPSWSAEVDATKGDDDDNKSYWPIVEQGILLVYNTDKYTEATAPKDWTDLWSKPQFKGRYQSETSLGGATTRLVMAGILDRYKDESGEMGVSDEGWKQVQGYFDNGTPAEKDVDLYSRMAKGTVDMGQMNSSNVPKWEKTYNVTSKPVIPSVGVPYAIEQVALVKGTKKADDAKKFIDWFGSAEVQGAWSKKFQSMPVNKGAIAQADPSVVKFHEGLPQQKIDYTFVQEHIDEWVEKIELEYMK